MLRCRRVGDGKVRLDMCPSRDVDTAGDISIPCDVASWTEISKAPHTDVHLPPNSRATRDSHLQHTSRCCCCRDDGFRLCYCLPHLQRPPDPLSARPAPRPLAFSCTQQHSRSSTADWARGSRLLHSSRGVFGSYLFSWRRQLIRWTNIN